MCEGLSISNDIVSTKYTINVTILILNCQFPIFMVIILALHPMESIISQLICFARASSHVDDFYTRNKLLTQKLVKQGYRYHNPPKTNSKFYRRYYNLISKFQVRLKSLLLQGLSDLNSMVTWCIN